MSTKTIAAAGIIIVLVGSGIAYMKSSSSSSDMNTADNPSVMEQRAQDGGAASQQAQAQSSASSTGSVSDASLDQDTQNIDGQMNALNSDNTKTDASANAQNQ
jgi:hypothetical protein